MNKRGISAIVAVVMTVLITVAAVAIIWVAIVPMINENIAFDELDGRVSIVSSGGYTVYDADEEVAIVQVKRDVDDGVMNRIKIIFVIGGDSYSSTVVAPESGQTKTYSFDLSGYDEPESVSVAPIFVSSSGSEKGGSVMSKVDLSLGDIDNEIVDSVEFKAKTYDLEEDYISDYSDLPVSGLVSWWRFDGDFDDSVGGNDGDYTDNETRGEGIDIGLNGIIDNVLVLDGDGDYVKINSGITDFSKSFTISSWVKIIESSSNKYFFSTNGENQLYIDEDIAAHRCYHCVASDIRSITPVVLNKWTLITLTHNSETSIRNIYIDKNLENSNLLVYDGSHNPNELESYIGVYAPGNDYYFHGSMDNVMIYNKDLTDSEITAIYENQMK